MHPWREVVSPRVALLPGPQLLQGEAYQPRVQSPGLPCIWGTGKMNEISAPWVHHLENRANNTDFADPTEGLNRLTSMRCPSLGLTRSGHPSRGS